MPHIPQALPFNRLTSLIFTRNYVSPKRVRQKKNYRETWKQIKKGGKGRGKSNPSEPDRDYRMAIKALESLRSNSSAKALFNDESQEEKRDPNQDAIPEMLAWLDRAGYKPQDLAQMRHIHIAGTKGKGSVADYATSILMEASRHLKIRPSDVGTYVSPHLVSHRERILINGTPVTEVSFARWFWHLWDRFTEAGLEDGMTQTDAEGPDSKPFYFRYMTILAWHIFVQSGVKHVVMECGIGGEYDATNVLPKEAVSTSVVTSLGLDHTAMLGDTVEKIAWHKAGIFKEGRTAIVSKDELEEVRQVLRERADEKGAKLLEIDHKEVEHWEGAPPDDDLIARKNQALAVAAVKSHHRIFFGTPTAENALQDVPIWMPSVMHATRLPGVRRIITKGDEHKIQWFLDGAHTKESLEGVAAWFVKQLGDDEQGYLIFHQHERPTQAALQKLLETFKRLTPNRETKLFKRILVHDPINWGPFMRRNPELTVARNGTSALWEIERLTGARVDAYEDEARRDQDGEEAEESQDDGEVKDLSKNEAKPQREPLKDAKVLVTGSFHLVGEVLTAFAEDDRRGIPRERFFR